MSEFLHQRDDILHLTFLRIMDHKYLGEFVDEKGLLLCGMVTPESLRRGLSLDLNSEDVIIASYPKSGKFRFFIIGYTQTGHKFVHPKVMHITPM